MLTREKIVSRVISLFLPRVDGRVWRQDDHLVIYKSQSKCMRRKILTSWSRLREVRGSRFKITSGENFFHVCKLFAIKGLFIF